MSRPRLTDLMTTREMARELGMGKDTFIRWIERGVLPLPTHIDSNNTRYFDQEWLGKAKEIVRRKRG